MVLKTTDSTGEGWDNSRVIFVVFEYFLMSGEIKGFLNNFALPKTINLKNVF